MDLKQLKQDATRDEEGFSLPIKQRDGEPYLSDDGLRQCTIPIVGSESPKYRKARDAYLRKALKKEIPAHQQRIDLACLAAELHPNPSWEGWEMDGQPVPFSIDTLQEMLKGNEHILQQVEIGIHRGANFFAKSS